jgi:hypothetical protein
VKKRQHWHSAVHQRLQETLNYYFLQFAPTFERDRIFISLRRFLRKQNITQYSCEEIFGPIDLVLRAWLPAGLDPHFQAKLEAHFHADRLTVQVPWSCQVLAQPYHWLWPDDGPTSRPRGNINRAELVSLQLNRDPAVIERCIRQNLLRLSSAADGIKLFLIIPGPGSGIHFNMFTINSIANTLRSHQPYFSEIEFYQTKGDIELIIEATFSLEHYKRLSPLIKDITTHGTNYFHIRTTTLLGAYSPEGTLISDELVSIKNMRRRFHPDPLQYLQMSEGQEMEYKASISLNFDNYLETGKEQYTKDNPMQTKILSTIAAYLNSNHGGKILIGALEDHRFNGRSRDRIEQLELINDLRVCGINLECDNVGGWDRYSRRIKSLCGSRIGREVGSYISVHKLEYNDKLLCLIHVDALPRGGAAFVKDKYYIRDDASTIELTGRDIMEYQRLRRPNTDMDTAEDYDC